MTRAGNILETVKKSNSSESLEVNEALPKDLGGTGFFEFSKPDSKYSKFYDIDLTIEYVRILHFSPVRVPEFLVKEDISKAKKVRGLVVGGYTVKVGTVSFDGKTTRTLISFEK